MKSKISLIICILLFIIANIAYAQTDRKNDNPDYYQESPPSYSEPASDVNKAAILQAAKALQKHSKQYYLGTGLLVGGYLVAGSAVNSENTGLFLVGSIASITGVVFQIVSHKQIGNAGRHLENALSLENSSIKKIELTGSHHGLGMGLALKF